MNAMNFLASRNPFDIPQWQWVDKLMTLEQYKGKKAIEGMAGFYLFAIERERERQGFNANHAIRATFAHDLNGAKDKFSEPRSAGYVEVWAAEVQKFQ